MKPPAEKSVQQLNPLGSAGNWELAVVLSLATFSYVMFAAIASTAKSPSPLAVLGAVVLMTAAIVLNLVKSAPRGKPYTRRGYILVVALGLAAALMQGLASTGEVASISTGWGPLALAGLLAAASPYRPQTDQLIAGLVATAVITVEKTLEGLASTLQYGLVYFVVMGIAPIVIITLGQAAYTGYAVRSLQAWHRGFGLTHATVTSLSNVGAAHAIGQGFLTEFGAEVRPLFARILSNGRVTQDDGQVAALAAERIRERLVSVMQETWLERLDVTVNGSALLANQVEQSARAALTALLTELPRLGVTDIVVSLDQRAGRDSGARGVG